uniref:ZAD domain-containing protein n=1 Tax=Anopheles christyi TaxID=43041 RepID=A0A182JU77_9DIPT
MSTITLPSTDCTKFCRFCLSEINLLNVIGSSTQEQESHVDLLRLVKTYLKLELLPSRDFPSAVCEMCIALLHDFDTMYQNVHDYRYALRLLLEAQKKEDVESAIPVNTIEPNLVEVYEPSPEMLFDTGNNVVEINTESDEQIMLEDGSAYSDANEQEAQIDVYHVDGQLQHIVMEGGTYIELQPFDTPKPSPLIAAPSVSQSPRSNNSLSKLGSQMSIRKRTSPANATTVSTNFQKKYVNHQPTPYPMGTPTRMLNAEPSPRRSPQVARTKMQQNETAGTPPNHLYRCPVCTHLFVELSNFYSHSCVKAPFPDGGVAFGNQSSPRVAASAVTITSEGQRYQCNLCDMSYRTKLQYQKHEYEVHRISNENFGIKCNICHKLFSQRQDYQLHMRAIHPKPGIGPSRPFSTTAILSCFTTRSITSRALVLGVTRSFSDVPLGKPVSYAAYTCRMLVAFVTEAPLFAAAAASVADGSGVLDTCSPVEEGTDCSTAIAPELGASDSGAGSATVSRGDCSATSVCCDRNFRYEITGWTAGGGRHHGH